MLRGSVRYFVICILSGVTFTALELIIPQILRLTVDSVIGDKPVSLPDALKSMWEGLGLGLYLTRRILTSEGGYIRVSSQPGKGSTFSLYLPLE